MNINDTLRRETIRTEMTISTHDVEKAIPVDVEYDVLMEGCVDPCIRFIALYPPSLADQKMIASFLEGAGLADALEWNIFIHHLDGKTLEDVLPMSISIKIEGIDQP